jgi:1-acyl-sn-glycerol-3-phosphate acyltransferase
MLSKMCAFRLAVDHGPPIVPITLPDNKNDFHLLFLSGSPGLMRVKIHHPAHSC